MKEIAFRTEGTCSERIVIRVKGGRIESVSFEGGCHGNTQGLAALAQGMTVAKAIRRLKGILCGDKGTSCPDQLARALESLARG